MSSGFGDKFVDKKKLTDSKKGFILNLVEISGERIASKSSSGTPMVYQLRLKRAVVSVTIVCI